MLADEFGAGDDGVEPVAGGEEAGDVGGGDPAHLVVFGAEGDGRRVGDGAGVEEAKQFVFRAGGAAVEMGGTDDELDFDGDADFFQRFPMEGFFVTFALVYPAGDAFPMAGAHVFGGGAAQEQVAVYGFIPNEGGDAAEEMADGHGGYSASSGGRSASSASAMAANASFSGWLTRTPPKPRWPPSLAARATLVAIAITHFLYSSASCSIAFV